MAAHHWRPGARTGSPASRAVARLHRRHQPTAAYAVLTLAATPLTSSPTRSRISRPLTLWTPPYILSECLRTTHRQAIEDRPTAVRDAHKEPYTLADYLYRLRCKRNYGDNISFIRGPLTEDESRGLQDDFLYLAGATALVYEHRLMAIPHPGSQAPLREHLLGWVRQWLTMSVADTDADPVALRTRLALYDAQV